MLVKQVRLHQKYTVYDNQQFSLLHQLVFMSDSVNHSLSSFFKCIVSFRNKSSDCFHKKVTELFTRPFHSKTLEQITNNSSHFLLIWNSFIGKADMYKVTGNVVSLMSKLLNISFLFIELYTISHLRVVVAMLIWAEHISQTVIM